MSSDDAIERAYAWMDQRPDLGDRMQVIAHNSAAIQVVKELVDCVTDLEETHMLRRLRATTDVAGVVE